MSKEKTKFKALIDTIEVSTDINNLKDFKSISDDRFEHIDIITDSFDNCQRRLKINLNNKYGEGTIKKLSEHNEIMINELKEIGVINMNNVNLSRVDVAFDSSDYEYQKDFKKMLFAYELMTIRNKKSSRWYTTNLNTLRNNSIKLYDSRFELEIYDKKDESKGTHPHNIRVEFRYKRLAKDVLDSEIYINKAIDKIKGMEGHLEMLEANMSDRLIKLWEVDKENVKSFSEFVRKYNDYFYTLNVLKEVYKGVGLKGSYSNWIKDFRKTNNIEFYSKSDIKEIQKAMLKSAKEYLKVDKKPSKTKEKSKDIEISDKEILKELDLL